jgi:phosphoglycolate phosphatase
MKYRCVIFDCDGTLIDTLEDIADAMNTALSAQGFPPVPLEKYRDIVGWGIFRLAELALPEGERTEHNIQTLGDHARRIMEEQENYISRPYPGIPQLVAELKAKKFALGVISNKPDAALCRMTDSLFAPLSFDAVCGLGPDMKAKPDPSAVWELLTELDRVPGETVFVGDSEIDMETARNAGCYPLGVSWGFRSRSTLETAGAARIIDTPGEIWEIIDRPRRHTGTYAD